MFHRFSFTIQKYGQLQTHVKNVTHFIGDYSDHMSLIQSGQKLLKMKISHVAFGLPLGLL